VAKHKTISSGEKKSAAWKSQPGKRNNNATFQFEDKRPEAIAQRKLQAMANNSPQAKRIAQLQAIANAHAASSIQKKDLEEDELQMKAAPDVQERPQLLSTPPGKSSVGMGTIQRALPTRTAFRASTKKKTFRISIRQVGNALHAYNTLLNGFGVNAAGLLAPDVPTALGTLNTLLDAIDHYLANALYRGRVPGTEVLRIRVINEMRIVKNRERQHNPVVDNAIAVLDLAGILPFKAWLGAQNWYQGWVGGGAGDCGIAAQAIEARLTVNGVLPGNVHVRTMMAFGPGGEKANHFVVLVTLADGATAAIDPTVRQFLGASERINLEGIWRANILNSRIAFGGNGYLPATNIFFQDVANFGAADLLFTGGVGNIAVNAASFGAFATL
jgi:hypothetical protein